MSKMAKMVLALAACNIALAVIGGYLLWTAFQFAKTQGWIH